MATVDELISDADTRMGKPVEHARNEFNTARTERGDESPHGARRQRRRGRGRRAPRGGPGPEADGRSHETDRRPVEAQRGGGHGGLTSVSGTDADPAAEHGLPEVARAVAIIMDGNGRWAAARSLTVAEGHRAGSRALRPVVETAIDAGVESLAVYAFSTENWARSGDEVSALMEIFGETIDRELLDLAEQGVRTQFVGRRDRAPEWLQAKMRELEEATAGEAKLSLSIAFDYGGGAELVEAGRRIADS